MNNKTIIIWVGISLVTAIAVLEVFDLHPQFEINRYNISWMGMRHMDMGFRSWNFEITYGDRRFLGSQYYFGPVLVMTLPPTTFLDSPSLKKGP